MRASDYADEDISVWPDNWRSLLFFNDLGAGCWAAGNKGPIGLRFETFREVRLAHRITADEWPQVFADLQVLERAALDEMRGTA